MSLREGSMPFAPLIGCSLYYEVTGEGPPIVFAHGAGGNHVIWYQQVAYFSDRYRCITFDHRSYGQSVDESGEGWPAYPRDIEGLLDHLQIPSTFLVAQSMGGFSCFPFAAHRPERVRKLVMADTCLGVDDALGEEVNRNRAAWGMEGIGGFTREYRETQQTSFFLYLQIAGLNRPQVPVPPKTSVTAADLAAFKVPTLFLVGSADYLVTPEITLRAQALVPGSKYTLVRGPGHSVYWEEPAIFNHIVESFFEDGQ